MTMRVKFKLLTWLKPDDKKENDVLTFGPSAKPLPGSEPQGKFSVSLPKAEVADLKLGADYIFELVDE